MSLRMVPFPPPTLDELRSEMARIEAEPGAAIVIIGEWPRDISDVPHWRVAVFSNAEREIVRKQLRWIRSKRQWEGA
jgi:hypothetical protein